ncbi:MAG: C40 family peptidase [Sulfuricurvum sp.]|nr:C40 family peptidase [Sulfuricurvum sp.]MDP3022027.1 C40 family peptidase [Sulfuricurvum sp.]
MIKRCLTLSLLILNSALQADSNMRREPSLFLEYEREVTRTIDTTQDEPNPFKKIIAPITPKAPIQRQVVLTEPVKPLPPSDKPEIGNDALPFLVISKPVSPSIAVPISCPTIPDSTVIAKNEEKSKKSLFENIHSVKDRIMARAKQLLGTPYGFGNKEVAQTDCSGFTQQVFSQFGVSLPHSAAEQAQYGKEVDSNDLQVGDLMFYRTYKDEPSHVGIYAGDGQIIHASYKNRRVQYDAINKGYYKQRFMYAKRLALNNYDASSE